MDYPIKTLQQLRPILVGFRKQAGLSQVALASLLGITQQGYAKIEANPEKASVKRLYIILRLLGTEMVLTQRTAEKTPQTSLLAQKTKKARPPAPPKLIPPGGKKEEW